MDDLPCTVDATTRVNVCRCCGWLTMFRSRYYSPCQAAQLGPAAGPALTPGWPRPASGPAGCARGAARRGLGRADQPPACGARRPPPGPSCSTAATAPVGREANDADGERRWEIGRRQRRRWLRSWCWCDHGDDDDDVMIIMIMKVMVVMVVMMWCDGDDYDYDGGAAANEDHEIIITHVQYCRLVSRLVKLTCPSSL